MILGLTAVISVTGALMTITNVEVAHAVGSLVFGIALVLVVAGRSELFTENFLVPVAAAFSGDGRIIGLARMWTWTLVFNLLGLALLAAILSIDGILPTGAHEAAGELAKTFEDRSFLAALGSAVAGGLVMTSFTWVAVALSSDGARMALAMLIGFLLVLPSLNHAVVAFGEVMVALFAGTSHIGALDLIGRELTAIFGNLVGGLAFVTAIRLVQVRGEPG